MADKKLSPFDFLNSINITKQYLMVDDIVEKQYVPFMVNRTLSYFPDTVLIANEMNRYHHLDKKLQYDFLINIVRKRKRFTKWMKREKSADVDIVKEFYGYSDEKAHQALEILTPDQLKIIKNKVSKGGRRK